MNHFSLPRRAAFAALALTCLLSRAATAGAATFVCGADAAQNTTAILCSGASDCSDTAVVVKENIDVESGACVFDLGGRDLTFTKTLQVDGVTGSIEVDGAGAITVDDNGKLKARGDFPSRAVPASGGEITLHAATTIEHRGVIDGSGNPAGTVHLIAGSDVTIVGNSQIVVNGISNSDQGDHVAPAGEILIESTTGSVADNGFLDLIGDAEANGGSLHVQAAGSITISKVADATGGMGGGGSVELVAGDDVTVTKTLDVDSTQGGGSGGTITIQAGADQLGGLAPGGSVDVEAPLLLNGSSSQSASGDGGVLHVTAGGDIRFTGANVSIHANAGASFGGNGGEIVLDSGDGNAYVLGPRDGDVVLGGVVTTRGGATGGTGGAMTLTAGKDLFFDADTEMHGKDSGGEFQGTAGGSVTINRELAADATNVAGMGGNISFVAGLAQNAALTLKEDITVEAAAGSNGTARKITLAGCGITIESDTRVDADADTAVGSGTGGTIELISRTPIQILPRAAFFARPGGTIVTIHPVGADPVIAGSASFDPARTDDATSDAPYPSCGGPAPSPTATPLPGQLGLSDRTAAKAADKCQQAIGAAAARFVAAKLKLLASCTDALFKCIQTKPEAGGKRDQCLAKARTKCDGQLRRIGTATASFTAAITGKCAAGAGLDALVASNGLAFTKLGGNCGAPGSVAAVATCVASDHACRADEIFERAAPRALELMQVAGVAADALDGVACLQPDDGTGLDLDRESDAGKQVAKCAHDVGKVAASFANHALGGLAKCVTKIFGCVQAHADVDAVAACVVPKVVSKCNAALARIAAGKAALRTAVMKSCGALDYESLLAAADGMALSNVDCGAGNASGFADCLADAETCHVDQLLRVAIPRTDELLGTFGLALPAGNCAP